LKEQPMHGYELRHYLSFIVGHIWQLSYGTLYPALRRLEKRGELTKQTIRDGKGPAKHVYALTAQGERTFQTLMREVASPTEISDTH
jgi:DNA-binding PadR family transcriptional regulator